MKEKDSRGHWFEWVDQVPGSMDCGFACAATVARHYLGNSTAMDLTKGISAMKPGAGTQGGTGTMQNVAHVLHSRKVKVWNAAQTTPAGLVLAVQAYVTKKTPAVLGIAILGVKHMTVAIEVFTNSNGVPIVVFLDPDPRVGLLEIPLSSFPNYATPLGTGTFDGWILCTHS